MNRAREDLIAGLTEELEPVRAFRPRDGFAIVAVTAIVSFALTQLGEGVWMEGVAGGASPFFWVTNGLLLLLGFAATVTVIAMASPSVGHKHETPKWGAAMVSVLPLAALISITSRPEGFAVLQDGYVWHCISSSMLASALTLIGLALWLRRGAPVSINMAGWFAGLAAGAIGTVVYGLSCPVDTIAHLGIWHTTPLFAMAVIGRIAIPRIISW